MVLTKKAYNTYEQGDGEHKCYNIYYSDDGKYNMQEETHVPSRDATKLSYLFGSVVCIK